MTLRDVRSGGRWLAMAALMALSACSHGSRNEDKKGETRCPESRNLSCITGTQCSMDRERGCETCQCSKADALSPTDQRRPEAMQPTRFGP